MQVRRRICACACLYVCIPVRVCVNMSVRMRARGVLAHLRECVSGEQVRFGLRPCSLPGSWAAHSRNGPHSHCHSALAQPVASGCMRCDPFAAARAAATTQPCKPGIALDGHVTSLSTRVFQHVASCACTGGARRGMRAGAARVPVRRPARICMAAGAHLQPGLVHAQLQLGQGRQTTHKGHITAGPRQLTWGQGLAQGGQGGQGCGHSTPPACAHVHVGACGSCACLFLCTSASAPQPSSLPTHVASPKLAFARMCRAGLPMASGCAAAEEVCNGGCPVLLKSMPPRVDWCICDDALHRVQASRASGTPEQPFSFTQAHAHCPCICAQPPLTTPSPTSGHQRGALTPTRSPDCTAEL